MAKVATTLGLVMSVWHGPTPREGPAAGGNGLAQTVEAGQRIIRDEDSSGQRYGELAGDLSGECVQDDDLAK
jgi:hypothetical protein